MRCPFCRNREDRVVDSRISGDGGTIRRRRMCASCERRFTTYERVEEAAPMVVKKDNRREPFDRANSTAGLTPVCVNRPVSMDMIEQIANRIESSMGEQGDQYRPSNATANAVMNKVDKIDQVP